MKIISTQRRYTLLNGQVTNANNPAYLYEITNQGNITQRHNMVLNTLTSDLLKKGLDTNLATQLDGYSFHNLCLSVFGPYLVNSLGEQIYTFRNDGTMVKMDPGTKAAGDTYNVKMPKQLFACVSYESGGAVKGIDYLAILNSGAIRFQYKYVPTSYRMDVLLQNEMPDDVKNHLLNKGGQKLDDNASNVTQNNPAIAFKLLLDLLDEEETNGDKTNHSN